MKIHNLEQCSEEWFAVRSDKLTASHAQAIGNCGRGLDTYVLELMSSHYSTGERDSYTNSNMERGIELEDTARQMYELENDCEVEQVGFVEFDECSGFSPDGFIGDNGGLEIKCLNDKNHFKVILEGIKAVDKKYLWQCQMSLLLSGRDYWDLLCYNPNYKESMIVFRITPEKERQDKLKKGLELGTQKIKTIKQSYEKEINKKKRS